MGKPFSIDMTPGQGVLTVAVTGEVDVATAPELAAVLTGAVEGGVPRVELDLAATEFFGSDGIRCLIEAQQLGQSRGVELVVVEMSEIVRSVLDVSGLTSAFSVDVA